MQVDEVLWPPSVLVASVQDWVLRTGWQGNSSFVLF